MFGHSGDFLRAVKAIHDQSREPHTRTAIVDLVEQSRGLFIEDAHLAAAWPHFPDPGLDALGFLIP